MIIAHALDAFVVGFKIKFNLLAAFTGRRFEANDLSISLQLLKAFCWAGNFSTLQTKKSHNNLNDQVHL